MNPDQIVQMLTRLADGSMTFAEAAALAAQSGGAVDDIGCARIDYARSRRCGFPEFIYGAGKNASQIAAIAEANYIPFAPHNPSGPIANAATLQLAACCPNFCILEIMYSDVDYRKYITNENLTYENGRIKIGDAPGLGIELNEEECLKHPYVEHNLRHYTGALTDIRPPKTEFYF